MSRTYQERLNLLSSLPTPRTYQGSCYDEGIHAIALAIVIVVTACDEGSREIKFSADLFATRKAECRKH